MYTGVDMFMWFQYLPVSIYTTAVLLAKLLQSTLFGIGTKISK